MRSRPLLPRGPIRWLCSLLFPALTLLSCLPGPLLAATIYVDAAAATGGNGASWATAFKTVARGLAAAGPGDTVEVAGGAYTGEILEAYTAASPSRAAPRAAKTAW